MFEFKNILLFLYKYLLNILFKKLIIDNIGMLQGFLISKLTHSSFATKKKLVKKKNKLNST